MSRWLRKQNLEDNQVNIVLFGPPGAGKGTQGDKLAKDFNLIKISTGDLLRNEIQKASSVGGKIKSIIDKGKFVSDDIINNLIENVLTNTNYYNRLIFDGYPRNLSQAKNLNILLKKCDQKIYCVLNLKVKKEAIIKRISGRLVCSKCGSIFNKYFNQATKNNHLCDSKFLETRSDDNLKTIKKRFETYNKETLPIIKYYINQNLLMEIDGMQKIHQIYKEIRQIIDSLETWLYEMYLYKWRF